MVDDTRIIGTGIAPTPQRQAGYAQGQEVKRRAAYTATREDARTQRALARLDRVLEGNQELRTDVPRGYYVNILV